MNRLILTAPLALLLFACAANEQTADNGKSGGGTLASENGSGGGNDDAEAPENGSGGGSAYAMADGPPNDLPGPTAEDACGASGYQGMVGENLAAVTMPADLNSRVIRPGEMMTMEYIAERMTIRINENGTITSIRCG